MSALGKFLVTIFFVGIVLILAIPNRDEVAFALPNSTEATRVSLALVILASVLVGFLWGAAIAWLNAGDARSEARRLRKEVKTLEQKI